MRRCVHPLVGQSVGPLVHRLIPHFLDGPKHLYKKVCPSVGLSVSRSSSVSLSVVCSFIHACTYCQKQPCNMKENSWSLLFSQIEVLLFLHLPITFGLAWRTYCKQQHIFLRMRVMLHINQIIKNPNWKLLRKDNPDHLFSKLPSEFPTRGPTPLRCLATSSQGMENNLKIFNSYSHYVLYHTGSKMIWLKYNEQPQK